MHRCVWADHFAVVKTLGSTLKVYLPPKDPLLLADALNLTMLLLDDVLLEEGGGSTLPRCIHWDD